MLITRRNYTGTHFISQCVLLNKGNGSMECLPHCTCLSLVRPIVDYGAVCWGSVRGGTDTCVRPGAQDCGKMCKYNERLELGNGGSAFCAVCSAYCGELAWKAIGDGLHRAYCLSGVDHDWKIGNRRQGAGGSGRVSGNIPLQTGPSSSGTNYL